MISAPPEPAQEAAPVQSAAVSQPAIPAQAPASKKAAAQAVAEQTAAVTAEIAENMAAGETEYRYPPISLLHESRGENHMAAGAELRNNSRRLAETLSSFGVDAKAGDVIHAPPSPGTNLRWIRGSSSPKSPICRMILRWRWEPAASALPPCPIKSPWWALRFPTKR